MTKPEPFTCLCCGREWTGRWCGGPAQWPVPPVCDGCTRDRWRSTTTEIARMPVRGTIRDRKVTRTISALVTAIETEAHRQQWSARHAAPRL